MLLETDDVDAVKRVDAEIATKKRTSRSTRIGLRLLTEEQKQNRRDEREQNRADAVKRIAPPLDQRQKIAADLENAIKKMSDLWFALVEFQSPVAGNWAFPMQPGFGKFDIADLNREMALALYAAARPVQGRLRMPQAASLDTGVAGRSAEGMANVVARQNQNLLAALRSAPLGHDDEESEAA